MKDNNSKKVLFGFLIFFVSFCLQALILWGLQIQYMSELGLQPLSYVSVLSICFSLLILSLFPLMLFANMINKKKDKKTLDK